MQCMAYDPRGTNCIIHRTAERVHVFCTVVKRELEQENNRLKQLLANAMLDNAILKEVLAKK